MYVGLTGTCRYSANSTSSSEASAMIVPPPGINTGRSASRIISTTCRMAPGRGPGCSKCKGTTPARVEVHLYFGFLDVYRQVYEHRTGPTFLRDAKGLPEGPHELAGLLYLDGPLGYGLGDLHDVPPPGRLLCAARWWGPGR